MTDSRQTENASFKTLRITEQEREMLWEASAIDRGRDRYRATFLTAKTKRDGTVQHESAELGDVAPGQIILKEMMLSALPHFQAAIDEAKREITSGRRGAHAEWWWLNATVNSQCIHCVILSPPG